jgi:hypothetical protein
MIQERKFLVVGSKSTQSTQIGNVIGLVRYIIVYLDKKDRKHYKIRYHCKNMTHVAGTSVEHLNGSESELEHVIAVVCVIMIRKFNPLNRYCF